MQYEKAHQRANALEAEHRRLDQQVKYLERRAILTPREQTQVTDLKKQKLLTKDRLHAIRSAIGE
jgi:uncharacterized protein YdcH (DUF465 family)